MRGVPLKHVDAINVVIIVVTCVLAHILPYHLLVFSYAVLGPAHYLTQISWLHDRRYFTNSTLLAPGMILLSLMAISGFYFLKSVGSIFGAVLLVLALWLALVSILPSRETIYHHFALVVGGLLIALVVYSPALAFSLSILLPSVVHVFIFTATFMWVGAEKNHKMSAYIAFIALLLCAGTFLFSTTATTLVPDLEGLPFFQPIVDTLQKIGFSNSTQVQLFGFLSFAYTYHYLNWFSKSEVINWHKIPRHRLYAIIFLYIVALSLYAYNYTIGLIVILALGYMHVLLEFPLNLRTFATILRLPPKQKVT